MRSGVVPFDLTGIHLFGVCVLWCDSIWSQLKSSFLVWSGVVSSEFLWSYLISHGSVWSNLVTFYFVWAILAWFVMPHLVSCHSLLISLFTSYYRIPDSFILLSLSSIQHILYSIQVCPVLPCSFLLVVCWHSWTCTGSFLIVYFLSRFLTLEWMYVRRQSMVYTVCWPR